MATNQPARAGTADNYVKQILGLAAKYQRDNPRLSEDEAVGTAIGYLDELRGTAGAKPKAQANRPKAGASYWDRVERAAQQYMRERPAHEPRLWHEAYEYGRAYVAAGGT